MTMLDDTSATKPGHSVYIPVLIGLVALVGFLAFQCVEFVQVRGALKGQREGQNSAYDASEKMRARFGTIASKTADLAQKGDADAKAIVDAYAKRGLQFVPTAKPKS